MAIQPVDPRQMGDGWGVTFESRPADGADFARIFDDSLEKAKDGGQVSEKASEAAEILRLEMMRSAVSLSGTMPEPATANVGNALKAFLTNYGGESQKTDTDESKLPQSEETQDLPAGGAAVRTLDRAEARHPIPGSPQ